jgi:hypothetical protein
VANYPEEPTIFQRNPTSFRETHHLSEQPTIFQRNPTSFREIHHLSEEPNIFQRNPPSLCVFGFEPEEDIIPIEFERAWGGIPLACTSVVRAPSFCS